VVHYKRSRGSHPFMSTGRDIELYEGPHDGIITGTTDHPGNLLAIVKDAGQAAHFAWEEFFEAEIANPHTRANYLLAVRRFLAWAEGRHLELIRITPGDVGRYFQGLDLAVPTKKLHRAALNRFFDRLVTRHVCLINPVASVRTERHAVIEGKTPDIGVDHATRLLRSVNTRTAAGLRRLVSEQNGPTDITLGFNWSTKRESDHYPFYARRIPYLMFHTRKHEN